ncbi:MULTISPECIES: PTS sugar transporter subunit IIA [Lactobacillus]|uniref:PTS sugar transporter subunit IIA n=1 Tax=Lactobacillus TaxID=1578 RepID=UPI0018DB70F0|nr:MULTISPECIES: PTS sugar transporter subunit IIA [unclassified Lactobacillus]MBI0121531.1 PTS sugar transporter subunit IIA [Lactobacillus sp. M0398]MBI0123678.1 PTS sugar transporter subunit IIA [Lactobacillus sp. W8174]MBI0135692.1 PTS sugar transporter subunit IIA [Lactobacillus sp. W8173]
MVGVIICTHGNSAPELLKSAEMICGKQENCQTVCFTDGESLEQLKSEISEKISQLKGTVFCLTDLKGGTPFNTLVRLLKSNPEMEIITGVNIPMLLELFINRSQLKKEELLSGIMTAGKTGIYRYQEVEPSADDEEF